jgi:Calcium binding
MRKRNRHSKHTVSSHPTNFKVGDSVSVKTGVQDPDFGGDIGGWQGRVTEVRADEQGIPMLDLQWDSLTLQQIPGTAIEHCEEGGLDWGTMGLYAHEVEAAKPRDKPADVAKILEELSATYAWAYLGEQGKRIQAVLSSVFEGDDMEDIDDLDELEDLADLEAFNAWSEYLGKRLRFPIDAQVSEVQERGPLQAGDLVKVTGIQDVEDLYGILVDVRAGHRKFVFPLCDLEAMDESSSNYELMDDYAVWFANR